MSLLYDDILQPVMLAAFCINTICIEFPFGLSNLGQQSLLKNTSILFVNWVDDGISENGQMVVRRGVGEEKN